MPRCSGSSRPRISVEVAYVGNKGTHVFAGEGPDYDFNQPTLVGFAQGVSTNERKPYYQKFGWTQGFRYFGNDADNHYNSLQTKVEKRFSRATRFWLTTPTPTPRITNPATTPSTEP